MKTRKTVLSAVLAAVVFVLTRFVSVPSMTAVGNVNLGDCAVLLSAWILPPQYALPAAGIGSALADLLSPFAVYTLPTFLIKGGMAVAACIIFSKFKAKPLGLIISGVTAELIMIAGYFVFEGIFICGWATALLNIPFNAVQGVAGLISGVILYSAIHKYIKR